MAKTVKKAPVHNGKPITAFFARSSTGPASSQDASRSGGQSPSKTSTPIVEIQTITRMTNTQASNTNLNSNFSTKLTASHSPLTETSAKSPRRSGRTHTASMSLKPPSTMSSLKRLRSPSMLDSTGEPPSTLPNKHAVSPQGRSKFDSDPEESKSATVYVSTLNPKSQKRARLSTAEDPELSELLIPSSQSDEEEVSIFNDSPKLKTNAADNNYPALHTPRSLTPERDIDAMQIDNSACESLNPLDLPSSPVVEGPSSQQGSEPFDQMMTPPPSDLPSVHSTPVALNPASKTAQIIADIKARAYAQATSSPENVPLEMVEPSDSSSDEDDFLPILPQIRTTPTTSKLEDSKKEPSDTQRTGRYSLRKRSSSPTHTRAPAKASLTKNNRKPPPKKIVDPFAALLKEKRLAQKRGNGDDAFTRAEIRTHLGANGLLHEMEEDEDEALSEKDDEKIAKLVENPDLFADDIVNIKLAPEKNSKRGGTDGIRGEDDNTVLGPKGGKAILDILKQDKALKRHDEILQKTPGIRFWTSSPGECDAVPPMRDLSLCRLFGSSGLIRIYNACLQRRDHVRAATLLNKNFINSLDVCDRDAVSSDLYDTVFSYPPAPDVLCEAATNALEEFWLANDEPHTNCISFPRILATVQALGGNTTIISGQQWSVLDTEVFRDTTINSRETVVFRLLMLITACARSKRLLQHEIPDIVTILLLVAMDETSSSSLTQDTILTIDLVCNCILEQNIEIQLSTKILQCVQAYEPINKSRLVEFLSNGSLTTRRIANFVAYCIIADNTCPDNTLYSDTPPLPGVIRRLAPYSKSSVLPPGKFALHQSTDYVDLGFYVTILGVAVSNLRNYVAQERQASAVRNSTALTQGSPRRPNEKPKTDLQLVHSGLETLHSNIADTRATHLERSRTKAGIKGLAMNIHYQREHWLKNGSDARPRTLVAYFQKKSKP